MIFTIDTPEDYDFYLEHLIEAYIMLYSEEPFNRKDVTREHAIEFFNETFEHGHIFVMTKKDKHSVFGFRTVIDPSRIESFNCVDISDNSKYLSGIWIEKHLRGTGLGDDLNDFSINKIREIYNPHKIYVRTPVNNSAIEHVLHTSGFNILTEHKSKLNGVEMDLHIWEKILLFKNDEYN